MLPWYSMLPCYCEAAACDWSGLCFNMLVTVLDISIVNEKKIFINKRCFKLMCFSMFFIYTLIWKNVYAKRGRGTILWLFHWARFAIKMKIKLEKGTQVKKSHVRCSRVEILNFHVFPWVNHKGLKIVLPVKGKTLFYKATIKWARYSKTESLVLLK